MAYFQWLILFFIFLIYSTILSHFLFLITLVDLYNQQLQAAWIILNNLTVDEQLTKSFFDKKSLQTWSVRKSNNHFVLQWKTEDKVWLCVIQKKLHQACIAEE